MALEEGGGAGEVGVGVGMGGVDAGEEGDNERRFTTQAETSMRRVDAG